MKVIKTGIIRIKQIDKVIEYEIQDCGYDEGYFYYRAKTGLMPIFNQVFGAELRLHPEIDADYIVRNLEVDRFEEVFKLGVQKEYNQLFNEIELEEWLEGVRQEIKEQGLYGEYLYGQCLEGRNEK